MPDFRRKNIRLPKSCYRGRHWYFLTLCTEGRERWFLDRSLAGDLVEQLRELSCRERFTVTAYCVMPDHFHLLTNGERDDCDLLPFIKVFKQQSGFAFKQRTQERLWQSRYYDHILRPDDPWECVAEYIWLNPVRAGLCSQAVEWPLSGSFSINWRNLMSIPQPDWIPPWKRTP